MAENSNSGFPLLRFQPFGVDNEVVGQRNKVEQMKERAMRDFHARVLQNNENARRTHLGQQRLQMESYDDQEVAEESIRSAHSTHSERQAEPSRETEGDLEDTQEGVTSMASVPQVSVADAATSDTQINDGFAMPRGVFQSYLKLGEQLVGPEVNATNAAFQMKMAQAMQREMEKRIRTKVDFSTMTQEQVDSAMLTDPAMEVIRTAEAATSITKDAGSDPIQEAIDEYNLKRHNNIIPPDIFMGLRFADQDAPSQEPTDKGRSFLNVVDIQGSAILKDIPEKSQKAQPMDSQQMMDSALLTSQQTAQQMGVLEESLRRKYDPTPSIPQARSGYDSLTVKLFDDLKPGDRNSLSVAVLPRSSQSQPKAAMIRRLRDMSDQIKTIDEMSQNIERDFKSSHLLLSTIQDVNESIQISQSTSPDRMRPKPYKELRYSLDDEDEMSERLSPSGTPVPRISAHSPQASARSAKSRSTLGSQSAGTLTLSGSEMTNLISEVLAQEGVDMQSAGFPQEIAKLLEKDAKEFLKTTEMPRTVLSPRDKLIHMKNAEEIRMKRTEEEQENLKMWMTEKFKQRQERYMQRRRDLIEREPKPFKSQPSPSRMNIKMLNDEMSEKRKNMASEFMSQRLAEAESLMGSIIVDKPELVSEAAGDFSQRGSFSSPRRSPKRSPRRIHSPSRVATKTFPKSEVSDSRLSRPRSRRTVSAATWTRQKSPSHPDSTRPRQESPPIKGILKSSSGKDIQQVDSELYLDRQLLGSITEGSMSVDSSADLINYARAVLEMDQRGDTPIASFDSSSQSAPRRQQVPAPAQPERKVKSKSLNQIVRLQRPEVTRKWKEMNVQRRQEDEDMANRVQQEEYNKAAAQMYQTEKQKIYDSKQIPGSSPRQTVTIPRRVKTYSERLQEMKPTKKAFAPSIIRAPGSARTMSSHTVRTISSSRRHAPPHKPQTYVQQLQHLSATANTEPRPRRAATKKVPVQSRTFMRAHGPMHKPQTYAEQLQSLNPHPQRERSGVTMSGTQATDHAARHQTRSRPYRNPYSEMDYEELASVLSDWDMGDDIKNIIYGGSTPSNSVTFMMDDMDTGTSARGHGYVAPSEGQSDYFDVIMNEERPFSDGDDFAGDDYRASVDINEIHKIADAASVRSDSVLSVIDWDKIDDLIRDV